MPPLTRARAAAEAPSLLDALARAPAAAALVVAALQDERADAYGFKDNRDVKALRLVHTQLRDAVGEATTKIEVGSRAAAAAAPARPPTPARWPHLEALCLRGLDLPALEALGSETCGSLRKLRVAGSPFIFDAPCALAAAMRRMPALRALELRYCPLSDAALAGDAAAALFGASSAEDAPQLRTLRISNAILTPAAARLLAATGWQLEELDLSYNHQLGAAGLAALLVAPTFALRRLVLSQCGLRAADILTVANAPWPLAELDLSANDFRSAAAAPALAALSRRVGLRRLDVGDCRLSAAGFKALVEAAWPALTSLCMRRAVVAFDGPHALGAAAFAGFPALEELDLSYVALGEAGAALLASRRWARLWALCLRQAQLDAAGLTALVRGAWPALEDMDLSHNDLSSAAAAPALAALSRHVGLRRLNITYCQLSAAGFKALAEASWPALTSLRAVNAQAAFDGAHALDAAAAFTGFPALEELDLAHVALGEAGAELLPRRHWARLKRLYLGVTRLGDAGVAALARGAWPALELLILISNDLCTPPTLEDARRWAPLLAELRL